LPGAIASADVWLGVAISLGADAALDVDVVLGVDVASGAGVVAAEAILVTPSPVPSAKAPAAKPNVIFLVLDITCPHFATARLRHLCC
jgi:hypothetical protein